MIGHSLNIIGSEWIIIIFVALALFLGSGQLPGAAKKLGKVFNEYKKVKTDVQNQMKQVSSDSVNISGPVKTRDKRTKLLQSPLEFDRREKQMSN